MVSQWDNCVGGLMSGSGQWGPQEKHMTCWEYVGRQYFEHTSMLPVGGHWVTKPSSHLHPAASVGRAVHSPLTCRPRTKWELNKTDCVGISSSRKQFHQCQPFLLAVSYYLLSLVCMIYWYYFWFLYGLFIELLVSSGFRSWFTQYKQIKEAICCFPTLYLSCSWDCFYIQVYSNIFWFFSEQKSLV